MRIVFDRTADERIRALVSECQDEVCWVGLARPVFNEDLSSVRYFRVSDIFVPRQEVTAATVDGVEDGVGSHLFEAYDHYTEGEDDSNIEHLIYFGHSHVNMSTSPSTVDTDAWEEWIGGKNTENRTRYFVTSIHNKKGESSGFIYINAPGFGVVHLSAQCGTEQDNANLTWAKNQLKEKVTRAVPKWQKKHHHQLHGTQFPLSYDMSNVASIATCQTELMTATNISAAEFHQFLAYLRANTSNTKTVFALMKELQKIPTAKRTTAQHNALEVLEWWEALDDADFGSAWEEEMYNV
jgi:hypothetical protein